MLGDNVLAGAEEEFVFANDNCLPASADQAHLDTASHFVIDCAVAKRREIKIRIHLAVQMREQVQVECSGNSPPVVVCRFQHSPGFSLDQRR